MLTTAAVRDATNWDSSVAGLGPNLTRHRLRRTGATWVADAGVPLHVLQEILGHASMETTRGYLHPDDRHLASAAEQANVFLSPSGQKRQTTRSTSPTRRLREVETMLGAVLAPFCSSQEFEPRAMSGRTRRHAKPDDLLYSLCFRDLGEG